MHLKKISISGFKSFADKIDIDFDQGVTGVVGPNGSGKSNIIDAVRWVMGEQNAKTLRGEKGTDIIFAGSTSRKSLGMAEVTLVFDNRDDQSFCPAEYQHEEEIGLTRRIYANGEREYLINQKPCRLKDITGFFTATGLGGRSYSMIQQGQVDRILNAKPEDVREILEEAAGTLVFKIRRQEAERRLESTAENLARIEDILREIDKQKKSLKAQAEKAKQHKELTDSLRAEELKLLAHNFFFLNEKREDLQKAIDEYLSEESELIEAVSDLEERQSALQERLSESDPEIRELQEQITLIRENIARAENIVATADDRVAHNRQRLEMIAEDLGADGQDLEMLEKQADAAQKEVDTANIDTGSIEEKIASLQDRLDKMDAQSQDYSERKEDIVDEISSIQRLIDGNLLRVEAADRDMEQLKYNRKEEQAKLRQLETDFGELQILLDAAQVKVSSEKKGLNQEIFTKQKLEKDIGQRELELADIKTSLDVSKEKYVTAKTRLMSFLDMQAEHSDIVTIAAKIRELGGKDAIIGLLAEDVTFNEQADELSARARSAVEKWTERLVVKDLASLDEILKFTRENEWGGLPLSLIESGIELDAGAIEQWSQNFDAIPMSNYFHDGKKLDAYKPLLERLFYLPTVSLEDDMVATLPQGVVAFTSQGLCLYSADTLYLAQKNFDSILNRKEKIETLTTDRKVCEQELAKLQIEADKLQALQVEDRLKVRDIDQHLQEQNKDVIAVMTEFEGVKQQEEYKREALDATRDRLFSFDSQEQAIIDQKQELKENRKALEEELENAKNDLQNFQSDAGGADDEKNKVKSEQDQLRIELAKKQTRVQALQENFAHTRTQLERMQNLLSRRYEERARIEEDIAKIKLDFDAANGNIGDLLAQREVLESEFAEKREVSSAILEEQRAIESQLKQYREKQNNLQKKSNDKSLSLERVKASLETVFEQAQEKYQLDISTYICDIEENFEAEPQTKLVSSLRGRLERIGPINMMAIEEYEELSERETFILQQREEVLKSIDLLREAITEIEQTSKDKFLLIFHTINQEFKELFPILFPTGEAFLSLTHPDDPLNTGVEIMCRLPGKKMGRLNLFSGGEKALTGIALIFSLLKTKPTPFCFLDEVDAPLDEANVVRFNKVLAALSKRFQFIIITHNRRTMEILDTLYGITMQEPGVSKVVGVDMSRDIPDHLKNAFKKSEVGGATAH